MGPSQPKTQILAVDMGSNSIGWALIELHNNQPEKIVDCGVRIFEAGKDGDIESGRAESRATARRHARLLRRQTERRCRRKQKIINHLQKMGLLPRGKAKDIIPEIDRSISKENKVGFNEIRQGVSPDNLLPYLLRKKALDHKLQKHELGRAFYNLAQHRGYISNRKTRQQDDDSKVVFAGIAELEEEIKARNARTIGEYFASIDPHEKRIRNRYTHRQMFTHEFDSIWTAQKKHYPQLLTDQNYKYLFDAFFSQRPLKSSKNLIGKCELEPNCRRAPVACFEYQRFRYLQLINNIELLDKQTGEIRILTQKEGSKLIKAVETAGDLTFHQAKKIIGTKPKTVEFNLEKGEEKKIIGNRINGAICSAIGNDWLNLSDQQRQNLLHDLKSIRSSDVLTRKLTSKYDFTKEQAHSLSEICFEQGYASLSRKAIRKLLPLLEQGKPYATARKEIYGEMIANVEQKDILPPVNEFCIIRNPVVQRTMTELRKLVNTIIRNHGKPEIIRVELAREIKQPEKLRQQITRKMRQNEALNETAKERIRVKVPVQSPSRDDILKVRLADECNWQCPYTQKPIQMADLVGESPKFDIEHIIPFSRCLDDSFANKTLCYHEENRRVKCNKTPYEAYCGHDEKWDAIIGSVMRFNGSYRDSKLRKFQTTPQQLQDIQEFVSNQLNDTRYASKVAMQYLSTLYGGLWDNQGKRRVFAVNGQVTAIIRNMWDMNSILNDGGRKERNDHRHHAVDAIAVALTTSGLIHQLTKQSLPHWKRSGYKARFRQLPLPWKTFHQDIQKAIDSIIVSHRVDHKVNGPLHEETNYARIEHNGQTYVRVNRKLNTLKPSEVAKIAHSHIRCAVENKLRELNTSDPEKAFADERNYPVLPGRHGKGCTIRSVRINCNANPKPVGMKDNPRFCTPKSNHHMEILEITNSAKKSKWQAVVVDTLEAMNRLRMKEPVVKRNHGPKKKFIFSISPGDTLYFNNPDGFPEYLRVRTVSVSNSGATEIAGSALNDARKKADMKKAKQWYRIHSMNSFKNKQPQKVVVLPDGKVIKANN